MSHYNFISDDTRKERLPGKPNTTRCVHNIENVTHLHARPGSTIQTGALQSNTRLHELHVIFFTLYALDYELYVQTHICMQYIFICLYTCKEKVIYKCYIKMVYIMSF